MNKLPVSRPLPVGLALAALMLATRSHHFASPLHLPDASWAVFFLAGALLPGWRPLAALLGLAAAVDFLAIAFGGVSAFCVSPAYAALIPAYGALFAAGRLYTRWHRPAVSSLVPFATTALAGTLACELLSSGAFYVFSGRFAELSLATFGARLVQYLPLSVEGTALYLGAAAIVYAVIAALPGRHGSIAARP
ncbi:MAG: hypothetical protein AB7N69_07750 [Immundisolibacter sp.]|uniref:hypothetical protein n=1 Tax=Immundisolibacter sp. TaxID=1934948 RepID=UPI003D0E8C52